jgi:hypothetical protein
MLVGITPLLGLFHLSAPLLWFIAASLLAFIVASIDGPIAAFLTGCFPTEVRYTGVSIAYSLGAAIIGGLSPSLLVLLQEQFQSHNVLSLYLMGSAVIMLLTLLML